MSVSWEEVHQFADGIADLMEEWQGVPIPHPDLKLRLYPGHPLEKLYADEAVEPEPPLKVRNVWFDHQNHAYVWVYEEEGKLKHWLERVAPDRSMKRLDLWINTLGASIAWKYEAELTAREKLRSLISEYQWQRYDLTGSFLEKSPRSRVTYLFRRNRPTVALIPSKRGDEGAYMKCLAVLCLHPIGYYEGSWAGAMVPTDDVIAHLVLMRGDERLFWRKANQHEPVAPEAGL